MGAHHRQKFDETTRRQWELYSKRNEVQSMDEMKKFLEQGALALDASMTATNLPSKGKQMNSSNNVKRYQSCKVKTNCPSGFQVTQSTNACKFKRRKLKTDATFKKN